ncbi:MAG: DUF2147 domain-containing protein [Saprospiraceae bacterium]|nr:DUF2147 domain-containing protein [Saprospiraceae bacterium]
MKKSFLTFFSLLVFAVMLTAQNSPVGIWKTVDDETGDAKSHVEIYESNGKYYGKVVKLLKAATTTVCNECPGNKKGKPIEGMVIIDNLEPYKYYWANGEILDPKTGKVYGCSAWYENEDYNTLYVRGKHWTGLFRTQTWYRVK